MKRQSIIFGIIPLLTISLISCTQQRSGSDYQGKLSEIREEKVEVVNEINEALAASDVPEFKRKTESALDKLDNKINDYQDVMDNDDRKIEKQTREAIISMKQKKTAIEFKLDLLENSNWRDRSDNLSNNRVSDRPMAQGEVTRDERANELRDDDRISDVRTDERSDSDNYSELVSEIKRDLQELKTEIESFIQRDLN